MGRAGRPATVGPTGFAPPAVIGAVPGVTVFDNGALDGEAPETGAPDPALWFYPGSARWRAQGIFAHRRVS